MNPKQMFQFGAAAALLSAGLGVAGVAYACPAYDPVDQYYYRHLASGSAYWGNCANIKCPGGLCGQACGSGSTLYAVLEPNSLNFDDPSNPNVVGVLQACIDAFAYTGNKFDGSVEVTSFGTSASTTVTGVPATVQGSVYGAP